VAGVIRIEPSAVVWRGAEVEGTDDETLDQTLRRLTGVDIEAAQRWRRGDLANREAPQPLGRSLLTRSLDAARRPSREPEILVAANLQRLMAELGMALQQARREIAAKLRFIG
jgi:hypothetical protein